MKTHFYGQCKKKSYFEGWYFKQENQEQTLAVIPSFHVDREGEKSATIQVITEQDSWTLYFPAEAFQACRKRLGVRIGDNLFTERGLKLNLHGNGIDLEGTLRFGPFTPTEKEMMGPFFRIPGMQCSHQVLSLYHEIKGSVVLNGERINFNGGRGYLEKDRGTSFPKEYMWTQCGFEDQGPGCIMGAVADVPFLATSFRGCTCVVLHRGKQHRFATYTGAKVVLNAGRSVVIRQGDWELRMMALEENPRTLQAPEDGKMGRAIQESASCPVRYELWNGEERVFRISVDKAGWERG